MVAVAIARAVWYVRFDSPYDWVFDVTYVTAGTAMVLLTALPALYVARKGDRATAVPLDHPSRRDFPAATSRVS